MRLLVGAALDARKKIGKFGGGGQVASFLSVRDEDRGCPMVSKAG
jgi:hypothetical protein